MEQTCANLASFTASTAGQPLELLTFQRLQVVVLMPAAFLVASSNNSVVLSTPEKQPLRPRRPRADERRPSVAGRLADSLNKSARLRLSDLVTKFSMSGFGVGFDSASGLARSTNISPYKWRKNILQKKKKNSNREVSNFQ